MKVPRENKGRAKRRVARSLKKHLSRKRRKTLKGESSYTPYTMERHLEF